MRSPCQPPVESLPLRLILRLFQSLSLPAALALGRALGNLARLVMFRRHRVGMINLRVAFGPDISRRRMRRILRRMWMHFGCHAAEFFRHPLYRPGNLDRYVSWSGEEHIRRLDAEGRGILVVTAHLGNWDLLALSTGIRFRPVGLVAKTLRSDFWNRFLVAQRMEAYVHTFEKRNSIRGIIRTLRNSGIVGMVIDQDAMESDGRVFVEFFGEPASTISSVAVLSQRLDLPVLPMFIIRRRGGSHRIQVFPPLRFERRDTQEESIRHNTRRYLEVLERVIRRHPDQWNWIHRRWKRRPPGETDIY